METPWQGIGGSGGGGAAANQFGTDATLVSRSAVGTLNEVLFSTAGILQEDGDHYEMVARTRARAGFNGSIVCEFDAGTVQIGQVFALNVASANVIFHHIRIRRRSSNAFDYWECVQREQSGVPMETRVNSAFNVACDMAAANVGFRSRVSAYTAGTADGLALDFMALHP